MNDGFTGTFMHLWHLFPRERKLLLLVAPIIIIANIIICIYISILEILGKTWTNPFYDPNHKGESK